MREGVNVPFSFALLENEAVGPRWETRMRRAGLVLAEAAHHLETWRDPPVGSTAAREVFFTYANHLARQAASLGSVEESPHELAVRLEEIGRTCAGCHRFFRFETRR